LLTRKERFGGAGKNEEYITILIINEFKTFSKVQFFLFFLKDRVQLGGDLYLGIAGNGHKYADNDVVKFAVNDVRKDDEDAQKEGNDAAVITVGTDAVEGLVIA